LRFKVTVDWSKCEGSELCVTMCPAYVFEMRELTIGNSVKKVSYVIDENKCIGCFGCMIICPNNAITIEPKDLNKINRVRQTTLV